MTEKLLSKLSKPLTKAELTDIKKFKKSKYCTFIGTFTKFEMKNSSFGEDLFGFILENIYELPSNSPISDWQWFNLTEKFKTAFDTYRDEALPGKQIQFDGLKEANKKGYYTYRGNMLISTPNDVEYRILRPKNIQLL